MTPDGMCLAVSMFDLKPRTRAQLLDRWNRHTKLCPVCQKVDPPSHATHGSGLDLHTPQPTKRLLVDRDELRHPAACAGRCVSACLLKLCTRRRTGLSGLLRPSTQPVLLSARLCPCRP